MKKVKNTSPAEQKKKMAALKMLKKTSALHKGGKVDDKKDMHVQKQTHTSTKDHRKMILDRMGQRAEEV